ncbi:MAG: hypothetical protein A2Y98_02745 [Candidatus Portnoybacteria bacterium RBG_19FT_COMBO_36_7]|uniref:Uncharacterized protein n=1 Tax=Candidatus Portnoybacteria bacterium RBG_19FT_COMBO_36_7 TaxID=1801992 RepID=A0A1G2FAM0_9BACT|nr:MAG: hypothetical protein A2Y98_02745 [Candidatus Portnoybacteria bacterium RBG_19FT_COMBO_36_7]
MLKSNEPGKIDTIKSVSLVLKNEQELTSVFSRQYLNIILISLNRSLLAALLIFEILNALGILHYPVSFHWIALIITTGAAWTLLEAVFFISRENHSPALSNAIMLAAVAALYADTLGQVYSLFDRIIWYDQVLHFFVGGVLCGTVSFLLIQSLEHRGIIHLRTLGIASFAWITTIFLGLIYEFGEYLLDSITGSNSFVSIDDTFNDLLLGVTGSLSILTILVVYFYYARSVKIRQIDSPFGESIKDNKDNLV